GGGGSVRAGGDGVRGGACWRLHLDCSAPRQPACQGVCIRWYFGDVLRVEWSQCEHGCRDVQLHGFLLTAMRCILQSINAASCWSVSPVDLLAGAQAVQFGSHVEQYANSFSDCQDHDCLKDDPQANYQGLTSVQRVVQRSAEQHG